jgi:Protein of unknown function (DUF4232)
MSLQISGDSSSMSAGSSMCRWLVALIATLIPGAWVAGSSAIVSSQAPTTCRMSNFALRLGPWVSEATGQHTLALRLVSRSASSCVVKGYPSVRLSDRAGAIPFLIRHGGDQMITSRPPRRVLVRPGRSAFVLLNHYRCDRGGLRAATVVKIGLAAHPRGGTASLRITDPYRMPNYCGPGDPGSTLTVSPFEPTLRAALSG